MKNAGEGDGAVAEIQGLYGPFSFPEKLLQQIWARLEFDARTPVTTDGREVQIFHPGEWNLLGGPDFKNARLRLGEVSVTGDVELHLRAADWAAHRHANDPAYDNVVLHVVLFPTEEKTTTGANSRAIPILALLPLLHHDLEEYAADEAIERLADHPVARAYRELAVLPEDAMMHELRCGAERRWRQKVHYAALRIERLGWAPACHHTALEILGYRFNRAPMLAIAGAFPLEDWEARGDEIVAETLAQGGERWSLQGVRPANHPGKRLRQYAAWVAARPDWPQKLEAAMGELPNLAIPPTIAVGKMRRSHALSALRDRLAHQVCAGAVAGPRFDTLVCDGFLPLLAARKNRDAFSGLWFAWFAGDNPEKFARLLRELGVLKAPGRPRCHGLAQGVLGWMLAFDEAARAISPSSRGAGLDNISARKLF